MRLVSSIVYVALLGILSHYIGESLPRRLFNPECFPFRAYKWEKKGKLYEKIGIKKWKTRVPDMSRVMQDMLPKTVDRKMTSERALALIKETCVAEFIHKLLCVLSIGVYLIWKNWVGVMLTAVCIICNLPFIIIQRYNRPHLIAFYKRLLRREEKTNEAVDTVLQYG